MIPITTIADAYGRRTEVLVPPPQRQAYPLAAGVAQAIALPAGARTVLFAATTDIWVQYGAAAVLPTAAVTDGNAPEFNPVARDLSQVSALSVIAEKAGWLSLGFYG